MQTLQPVTTHVSVFASHSSQKCQQRFLDNVQSIFLDGESHSSLPHLTAQVLFLIRSMLSASRPQLISNAPSVIFHTVPYTFYQVVNTKPFPV